MNGKIFSLNFGAIQKSLTYQLKNMIEESLNENFVDENMGLK
jgi:hypothetical protein